MPLKRHREVIARSSGGVRGRVLGRRQPTSSFIKVQSRYEGHNPSAPLRSKEEEAEIHVRLGGHWRPLTHCAIRIHRHPIQARFSELQYPWTKSQWNGYTAERWSLSNGPPLTTGCYFRATVCAPRSEPQRYPHHRTCLPAEA